METSDYKAQFFVWDLYFFILFNPNKSSRDNDKEYWEALNQKKNKSWSQSG